MSIKHNNTNNNESKVKPKKAEEITTSNLKKNYTSIIDIHCTAFTVTTEV